MPEVLSFAEGHIRSRIGLEKVSNVTKNQTENSKPPGKELMQETIQEDKGRAIIAAESLFLHQTHKVNVQYTRRRLSFH